LGADTERKHRSAPNATLEEVRYPVERITVYRVHYDGFGPATRIAGWYLVAKDHYRLESEGRTPTIVQYHGYSGGKGVPGSYLHWALQGFGNIFSARLFKGNDEAVMPIHV